MKYIIKAFKHSRKNLKNIKSPNYYAGTNQEGKEIWTTEINNAVPLKSESVMEGIIRNARNNYKIVYKLNYDSDLIQNLIKQSKSN